MRITVAAIGRLKDGPERELFDRYWERFGTLGKKLSFAPVKLIEMPESRASSANARKADEAKRLLASSQEGDVEDRDPIFGAQQGGSERVT